MQFYNPLVFKDRPFLLVQPLVKLTLRDTPIRNVARQNSIPHGTGGGFPAAS